MCFLNHLIKNITKILLIGVIILFSMYQYRISINIFICIFIIFSINTIKERKIKKKYYPIVSTNMSKKQKDYILKELTINQYNFKAAYFKHKILNNLLADKDIEELNMYLKNLGVYIGKLKLY